MRTPTLCFSRHAGPGPSYARNGRAPVMTSSFFARLRERKLIQWTVGYLAVGWGIVEAASLVGDEFGWPAALVRSVTVVYGAGFFLVLILAWFHGDRGAQRVSGIELGLLALVVTGGTTATAVVARRAPAGVDGTAGAGAGAAAPTTDPVSERSIAVLPFVDLSESRDQAYLADGLAEELVNLLARIEDVNVAARSSAFQFRDSALDVRAVGERLRVAKVLEGSVRRVDDRLLVTAQLVDAGNGFHLWSEEYDRHVEDVFDIQSEIARAIVDALEIRLYPATLARVTERQRADPKAYDEYLRGRYFWNQRTDEGFRKAIDSFEAALAIDPDYAPAWSGLSDCYVSLFDYGLLSLEETTAEARRAAERALEIDESLAEAHTSLAHVHLHQWEWAEAEREFLRALELDPRAAASHHWYALALTAMGRVDEAIDEVRAARDLEPLSVLMNADLGMALYAGRRYDEAIAQERSTLELDPDARIAKWMLALSEERKGRYEEAETWLRDALERAPDDPNLLSSLAHTLALADRTAQAREIADSLIAVSYQPDFPSYTVAVALIGLEDYDEAFTWLNRMVDERSGWVRYMRVDPRLGPVRADPRFAELLQRVGLP